MKQDVFSEMVEKWPSAVVTRREAHRFSGGLVSSQTLANKDSKGEGPARRILLADRKVAYSAGDLADWLRDRCQVVTREV